MNEIINEKTYPIQGQWIIKDIIVSIPIFFIGVLLFYSYLIGLVNIPLNIQEIDSSSFFIIYIFSTIGLLTLAFISMFLRWKNYHYSLEEKFLIIKQGILSKQERHIPYGVIQNVFMRQDVFDRILGLASLTIENASQGGRAAMQFHSKRKRYYTTNLPPMIGATGNKVSIPGLLKQDSENFKNAILQKMKENPIDNTQSGL